MSFFGDLADAVRDVFGGGRSAQGAGGAPERSPRPQARPSILRRGDELFATRDIPEQGIRAGQSAAIPEFGGVSVQGLTSREAGNVMRNIQASERRDRQGGQMQERGDRQEPEQAKGVRPPEAAPEAPAPVEQAKGVRPTEEGAGESAAARARRLGLASMIATAPAGLLAGGQGTTRGRRSLMGGGMIQ